MASADLESLLNAIPSILAQDSDYPLDRTLLYVEAEPGVIGPSIFKDRGNHIIFRMPPHELSEALLDVWEGLDPDERWAEMEYVVTDNKFDVAFTYTEEIDPAEYHFERRDRIVRKYFGDKPIVYPSLDDDGNVFELPPRSAPP